MTEYAYTKGQTQEVLKAWGFPDQKLPTKGKEIQVVWPVGTVPGIAKISVHPQKSTYGKTLYRLVLA